MQFYFVFPALLFLMQKLGFLRIAVFVGLPVFIIGYLIGRYVHYFEPSLLFIKLNYFIAGILLFRFLEIGISRRRRYALALCAVLLVSLDFRYGRQLIVLPILLLLMLILGWLEAANRTPIWISSLVNSRFTRFASDSSYSVYLFHGFFISAFGLIISSQSSLLSLPPHQRVFLMFLFVATSAYLTAYMVYRFVELPGIRFGKHIIEKIAPTNIKQVYGNSDEMKHNMAVKRDAAR
jgi:peptidoglycan/LPS O-acetylase OafA/YrhL